MQVPKFQKLPNFYAKGRTPSVADMLGRSYTQKKLQLSQLKHKQ